MPEYFLRKIPTLPEDYKEKNNDDQMGLLKQVIKPRGLKVG